jgi:hypothetical protein
VRLEDLLPWLLAKVAEAIRDVRVSLKKRTTNSTTPREVLPPKNFKNEQIRRQTEHSIIAQISDRDYVRYVAGRACLICGRRPLRCASPAPASLLQRSKLVAKARHRPNGAGPHAMAKDPPAASGTGQNRYGWRKRGFSPGPRSPRSQWCQTRPSSQPAARKLQNQAN